MKIYGGRGRGNLGYVNVYLMCSSPEVNDPVRFYVDTGASRTTIADRDAIRLGLDYDHLEESPHPSVGIGCRNVKTYVIREVALVFDASRNAFHIEKLPVISVLKHEPRDEEERRNVDQIPSLLGVDLLEKYSVRFTKTHVVLEK
jgi:predicted aspartyl protease